MELDVTLETGRMLRSGYNDMVLIGVMWGEQPYGFLNRMLDK